MVKSSKEQSRLFYKPVEFINEKGKT